MSTEQLIKKKEENMISSFSKEMGVFFFSWLAFLSFPFSFFFIPKETLIPFLQDSPFLSRQFTFKPFNNYSPKKEEIALHKIFKL
jgi:hypothetical protein